MGQPASPRLRAVHALSYTAPMDRYVSHDPSEESFEAKARWFASLTMEQRFEMWGMFIEMVAECNPSLLRGKDVQPVPGRIQVIELP